MALVDSKCYSPVNLNVKKKRYFKTLLQQFVTMVNLDHHFDIYQSKDRKKVYRKRYSWFDQKRKNIN